MPRKAKWLFDTVPRAHVDLDAVAAYDRLTHDRIPSEMPTYPEEYEWGVGVRTLTKAEYDAQEGT